MTSQYTELVSALLTLCSGKGVIAVKAGDVEIEFAPASDKATPETVAEFQKALQGGMITEEDMLNWSAPGYVPSSERTRK